MDDLALEDVNCFTHAYTNNQGGGFTKNPEEDCFQYLCEVGKGFNKCPPFQYIPVPSKALPSTSQEAIASTSTGCQLENNSP